MKGVGCVILNYNDTKRVCELAITISKYKCIDRIIVVDNKSEEKQRKIFGNYHLPSNVEIVFNKENVGYNKGVNIGFRKLPPEKFKYILQVNSDVVVQEAAIVAFIAFLETHRDVAVVSCQMIENGKYRQMFYNFPTVKNEILANLGLRKIVKDTPQKRDEGKGYFLVDFVRGSLFCLRNDAGNKVQYFSDEIFLYFGEASLAKKLEGIGYKEALLTDFTYLHNHIYPKSKIAGYKTNYYDFLIYDKMFIKSTKIKLFVLKVSFYIGLFLRVIFRI